MGFFNLSSNKAWGAIKSTLKENSVVREMMGAKGLSNKLAAGAKAVSRLPAPARSGLVGAGIGAGAGALRAGSNDDGPLGFAGNVAAYLKNHNVTLVAYVRMEVGQGGK